LTDGSGGTNNATIGSGGVSISISVWSPMSTFNLVVEFFCKNSNISYMWGCGKHMQKWYGWSMWPHVTKPQAIQFWYGIFDEFRWKVKGAI